ncbi:MAG: DHHW family protein [Cytophagaceae bacterium]
MKKKTRTRLAYISIVVFTAATACLGTAFFILPKENVSVIEKRKLSPFPTWTFEGFHKGTYIDSIDLFVSDNFPFREKFVALSFDLKEKRGIRNEKISFHKKTVLTQKTVQKKTEDTLSKVQADTAKVATAENETGENEGILIYNGMAMQLFGGNKPIAQYFASVVNLYQDSLKDKVKVYCAVTPTHGEFYLPEEYSRSYSSEKNNIRFIYSKLDSGINKVDIYSKLEEHKSEYIFFNTDHHWTGLGAYYAYTAFCEKAGLEPVKLADMKKRTIRKFLGSLYWTTRDQRLLEKKDSVEYYKVQAKYKTFVSAEKDTIVFKASYLFAEGASGASSYGVFLGSDHPAMRVDTENQTGRKVLVLKNSYGNPFSTYLVANFDQVFIVDYRYLDISMSKLIEENGITDVIIIVPTFSANTKWHAYRLKKIL